MDVNVKDLNKFIGSDGVTVLDEVRVSPTEPAFRQNGYEANGDKKSFALAFDSGNSERILINKSNIINLLSDISFSISFNSSFISSSNSCLISFGAFNNGQFLLRSTSSTTATLLTAEQGQQNQTQSFFTINNGLNTISIINLQVLINGVNAATLIDKTLDINNNLYPIGVAGAGYFDGFYSNLILLNLTVDDDNYPLRRGLGVELIGSNGTTAEIKTSAANPQQRVNFGMWLKGDNINGWNPFAV